MVPNRKLWLNRKHGAKIGSCAAGSMVPKPEVVAETGSVVPNQKLCLNRKYGAKTGSYDYNQ